MARALDVLGGRWTLLIVRELLLGPRRYGELAEGLPGVATNLLADRLRDLEEAGCIRRPEEGRYELTGAGRELEPVLLGLARWGLDHAPRVGTGHPVSPASAVLLAKDFLRPSSATPDATYALELGGTPFELRIQGGKLALREGSALLPDAELYGDTNLFLAVLTGRMELGDAIDTGRLRLKGGSAGVRDLSALLRGVPRLTLV